jgi:predicted RNase H-like HicB family nuclease
VSDEPCNRATMVRLGALGRAGILCNVMLYLEQTRFNRGGAPKPPEQARQAQQEIFMRYIALVDGNAGAYGVVVPDLPGCTSAGPTTDEALRNAVEAVRLWVEDAIDDGEALPPPRSVEALRVNPEIAAALAVGAVLGMVPLVLDTGRAVRDNLSLDAGLLDAIDEAAKAHGLTRSAFLASAAREKIEGPSGSRGMHIDRTRPTSRLVAIPTDRVPNQSQAKRQDLNDA